MVFELFRWWYGAGWRQAISSVTLWTNNVRRAFSVPILLRTLFAPWRRIGGVGGKTIEEKFRSSIDNLISRFVGFATRVMVLITAGLMIFLVACGGIFIALIWPLIPLLIVFCLIRSITG